MGDSLPCPHSPMDDLEPVPFPKGPQLWGPAEASADLLCNHGRVVGTASYSTSRGERVGPLELSAVWASRQSPVRNASPSAYGLDLPPAPRKQTMLGGNWPSAGKNNVGLSK